MKPACDLLCRLVPALIMVALVSCAAPNQGYIGPGSEYGRGTNNGNSRPYRSDGRIVADNRPSPGMGYYPANQYNRYGRSPYGGGTVSRRYQEVHPVPVGYPSHRYRGFGYPAYGRW